MSTSLRDDISPNASCADCGGFRYDVERMYRCHIHEGVLFCLGCKCPRCAKDPEDISFVRRFWWLYSILIGVFMFWAIQAMWS